MDQLFYQYYQPSSAAPFVPPEGGGGPPDAAYDSSSESHTGSTGSTSETSFSWNHDPVASPNSILVFVFENANAESCTGVTYGGASLTRVPWSLSRDTSTEPGSVIAYFKGSSIPTDDPASVVVSRTNNANEMYAICIAFTGDTTMGIVGDPVKLQENQALSEQSVNTGSVTAVRVAALNSGLASATTINGASSTIARLIDFSAGRSAIAVYETTPGSGSRSIGFSAASDDVAAIHLAVANGNWAVFKATSNSGGVDCSSTTYSTARTGGGTLNLESYGTLYESGQKFATPNYYCYELFLEFDTSTIGGSSTVTSAVFAIDGGGDSSTTNFVSQVRKNDYGASLTTGDFVSGASLSALTLLATWDSTGSDPTGGWPGPYFKFVDVAFAANVEKTTPTRVIVTSDRLAAGTTPTTDEYGWVNVSTSGSEPTLSVFWS